MCEQYRFVISTPGDPAIVSTGTWSFQQAKEEGEKRAEELGLQNYEVSATPSDNPGSPSGCFHQEILSQIVSRNKDDSEPGTSEPGTEE